VAPGRIRQASLECETRAECGPKRLRARNAAYGGPFGYNLRPFCAESGIMPTMPETLEPTPVEAVIIGAGPVGLFQIF